MLAASGHMLNALPLVQVNYAPSHNAPVPDLRELGKHEAEKYMLANGEQKGPKLRKSVGKDEYTFTQSRR